MSDEKIRAEALEEAAQVLLSAEPNSRAEKVLGKLSEVTGLPSYVAGLLSDLCELWADDARDTANAIRALAKDRIGRDFKKFTVDLDAMLDDMRGEGWDDKTLDMVRTYAAESYRQLTGEKIG